MKIRIENINDYNLGQFEITQEYIDSYPDIVSFVLSGLIIVKADYSLPHAAMLYTAYSKDFEECSKCAIPPEYTCVISKITQEDGTIKYEKEWKKINQ